VHRKMPQNFDEHPHDVFSRKHLGQPVLGGSVADVVNTVAGTR